VREFAHILTKPRDCAKNGQKAEYTEVERRAASRQLQSEDAILVRFKNGENFLEHLRIVEQI